MCCRDGTFSANPNRGWEVLFQDEANIVTLLKEPSICRAPEACEPSDSSVSPCDQDVLLQEPANKPKSEPESTSSFGRLTQMTVEYSTPQHEATCDSSSISSSMKKHLDIKHTLPLRGGGGLCRGVWRFISVPQGTSEEEDGQSINAQMGLGSWQVLQALVAASHKSNLLCSSSACKGGTKPCLNSEHNSISNICVMNAVRGGRGQISESGVDDVNLKARSDDAEKTVGAEALDVEMRKFKDYGESTWAKAACGHHTSHKMHKRVGYDACHEGNNGTQQAAQQRCHVSPQPNKGASGRKKRSKSKARENMSKAQNSAPSAEEKRWTFPAAKVRRGVKKNRLVCIDVGCSKTPSFGSMLDMKRVTCG